MGMNKTAASDWLQCAVTNCHVMSVSAHTTQALHFTRKWDPFWIFWLKVKDKSMVHVATGYLQPLFNTKAAVL